MRRVLFSLILCLSILPSLVRAEEVRFVPPSWADSSGRDGKGGVSITTSGAMHNLVLRKDPCKEKIDKQTLADHGNWVIFDSDEDDSVSFEFTNITTADDKFWGKQWAGGGLAFNRSWGSIDLTGARYLVFWVKASNPGIDMDISLIGSTEGSESGVVMISDYADGRKIGTNWTKVIVPIQAIPNLAKVNLAEVKQIHLVHLAGTYPENKPSYLHFSKIHFTDSALVTPVENLGWLKVNGGAMIVWDKTDETGIETYLVNVDGKLAGQIKGSSKRQVKLPASILTGTGPHVVSVAAANAKQTSSFQAVTVTLGAGAQTASVQMSAQLGREISPYIYGLNGWSQDTKGLKKLGATLNRFGGNATTSYNWKDDAMNRGMDWFFLNTAEGASTAKESDKSYYKFVQRSLAGGSDIMMTIPIIGWVAKRPPEGVKMGSYPKSLFPGQVEDDGGCGPGFTSKERNMKSAIWGNDPNYNYIPSTPEFQKGWVQALVQSFGAASAKGVKFYSMDNETGLWRWNHRDVRPQGVGMEELANLNATYAAMVKSVDPTAKILGFVSWGVMELKGSDWDYLPGGKAGYKIGGDNMKPEEKWSDSKAHGVTSQAEYFLKTLKAKSDKAGVRLIDYFDNHGFPEVWGTNAQGQKVGVMGDYPYDPVMTPKQFDAMRIFWDDSFVSKESWCYDYGNAPDLWTPWVGIIPKLKAMIDQYYPGTKLAMTEYYPASKSYYHGGLLEAVNLGIFAREGMDLACDWGGVDTENYVFYGHMLFGNYDGKGSKFLGNYVDAKSSSPDIYSFGAKQGAVTRLVLVNKNHDEGFQTSVSLPSSATSYNTFVLSETLGKRIYEVGSQPATGASIKINVPAFSAVLVVAQ